MAMGRPSKYSDDVIIPKVLDFMVQQQLVEVKFRTRYFKGEPYNEDYEMGGAFPTCYTLSKHLEIDVDTIKDWKQKHPNFSAVMDEFRQLQKHFLIQNTLRGYYKENFAMFCMRNMFDWTDAPKIRIDARNLSDEEMLRLGKIAVSMMEQKENDNN